MRDVEKGSLQISRRLGNDEYAIPPSRLFDIETTGVVPSIFRLYTLAAIYRVDYHVLLSWYDVNLNGIAADVVVASPKRSHVSHISGSATEARIPVRLSPEFSLSTTTSIARMVERWGVAPLTYLPALIEGRYSYGYIGTEDLTMYPILPPGSFIQIDEAKTRVTEGPWRSEFERPIYFVETRDGFVCSWCQISGDSMFLQPHPLSPVPVRILRYPQEADVTGQVVGAAIRLGEWQVLHSASEQGEPAKSAKSA
jgi:hypothetical protein